MATRKPLVYIAGKLKELPAGDSIPVAGIPTLIAAGAVYSVPADTQVLYAQKITINGILDIDGIMTEVS